MERPALGQEYHQQILLDERKPGQRYHRAGRRSPRHLWRDARLQVLIKCRRTEADILHPSSGIRNNRSLEYGGPWMGKMGAPRQMGPGLQGAKMPVQSRLTQRWQPAL